MFDFQADEAEESYNFLRAGTGSVVGIGCGRKGPPCTWWRQSMAMNRSRVTEDERIRKEAEAW
eukprot:5449810-Alexandrium_andersonii.AAC.1